MKDHSSKKFVPVSFLAGLLTAATVGGFLFFGSKKSRRNRQKMDWWIEDAKEEVLAKTKKIKNLTQDKFDDIVDMVMKKYAKLLNLTDEIIYEVKEDLKERWEEMNEEMDEDDE